MYLELLWENDLSLRYMYWVVHDNWVYDRVYRKSKACNNNWGATTDTIFSLCVSLLLYIVWIDKNSILLYMYIEDLLFCFVFFKYYIPSNASAACTRIL